MKESQIERRLAVMVRERGGLCYKFVSPSNPGVPDRIIITPAGRTVYVELKTEIGRLAKIQEWQIDSVASFGMCIAFFLPQIITGEWFQPLIPYLDPALAIILSLFMLPVPVKTVITGLRDLFLLPPEEETVQEIKDIVSPILTTYGDTKLYYDILRTGRKLWISVYITMNRDMISISKFKSVQKEIIQALSKEYQDFYFELLPDIEYNGDTEVPEPVPDEEEA